MTRKKLVTIRFSLAEFAALTAAARAASTSRSALLRSRALDSMSTGEPAASAPLLMAQEGPLTRQVSSRLTASEAEDLTERARVCALSISAYVREVLRGGTPSPRRSDARAAVVALNRIGNNLNQLTRLAHSGTIHSQELSQTIDALRLEVHQVRDEILAAEGALP